MFRKSFGVFFLLAILFAAQEMAVVTEAKTCEALSDKFSGGCVGTTGNQQCDKVCRRLEHLLSGRCKGLQCYCTRNC